MQNGSKMLRMWVLYGLFFAVVVFCAGLFLFNVVSSGDAYHLDNLEQQLKKDNIHGLIITNLIRTDNVFHYDQPVETAAGMPQIQARTNTYDVLISSTDESQLQAGTMRWVMALQIVATISLLSIFVMLAIMLVGLFKAIRKGRVFRKQLVKWLWIIGLFVIVMTLSLDTSTYLERQVAYTLLQGTAWEPMHEYTLHVTRLFVGIIVLFMAEILRIGMAMQEEQDLTI